MPTLTIAVVIDADGDHCGEQCAAERFTGGARCSIFAQRLEVGTVQVPGEELPRPAPPLRCDACQRAERRMKKAASGRGQSAPDIRAGSRYNWRTRLSREEEAPR